MTTENSKRIFFAYCLTCNKKHGEAVPKHQSVRFLCPQDSEDNPTHITSVVDSTTFGWAKFQSLILRYETNWTPNRWRWLREHVGWYLIIRFLLILLSLVGIYFMHNFINVFFFVIAGFTIFDALVYTTSAAFVSRYYSVPLRSTLFSLFSFVQIVLAFAVFYLAFANSFNKCLNPISAVYFSFVTITTLGYGDFIPLANAWYIQALVVLN